MGILDYCSAFWASAHANLDAFGAAGLALGFATSLMPSRTMILLVSAGCGLCFSAHYLHLGSATGMAMSAISVAQSLLAARYATAEGKPIWFNTAFAVSVLLIAGLTLGTWSGWPSAFAGIGALFAAAARIQTSSQVVRLLLICATLCCAGHNTIVGSACGLTCDVLAILGFTLTFVRSGSILRRPNLRAAVVSA